MLTQIPQTMRVTRNRENLAVPKPVAVHQTVCQQENMELKSISKKKKKAGQSIRFPTIDIIK